MTPSEFGLVAIGIAIAIAIEKSRDEDSSSDNTGWIGVTYDPTAGGPGLLISEVLPDSPAWRSDVALEKVAQPPSEDLSASEDTQLRRVVDVLLADLESDSRTGAW